MSKLHEILAVEGDLEGTAKKVINEAVNTFVKKPDHFIAFEKHYEPFNEGVENELPSESKDLVTTVGDKLDYVFGHVNNWFDAVLQKESTNQIAKADIIIDGNIIAKDVPATFLLGLENKLKDVRNLVAMVPTLAPAIPWVADQVKGEGVYRSGKLQERIRTTKVMKPVVLYEATDKHPAQVKESTEDVAIGKYVQTDWCSMISPAEKSRVMGRVDALIRAVKQARQRANNVDVLKVKIGKTLSDYILKG
jgi:hypothetical protein